ncbi:membrane metallo-endopeptidase-like 1, partial [Stegodyphus dumicola]|uniref:membrane metallo-endopeptidase-like 1 n=1 Tax=Stegodyphus dumicola TaxID=202533 RepID=UPI0015AAAFD5
MNFLTNVLCQILLLACTCMTDVSAVRTSYVTDACRTPGCYKAGHVFTAYMNRSQIPCDDFYQFSCGAWQEEHLFPEGKNSVSVLSNRTHNHEMQLKTMLEIPEDENDAVFIKKIKRIYNSCKDTRYINAISDQHLLNMVESFISWPLLDGSTWSPASFDWLETLIKFRNKGYSYDILFSLSVTENPLNTSAYIIKLDRPSFGLNYSYIRNYLMADNFSYYINSYSDVMDKGLEYFIKEYNCKRGRPYVEESEISESLNEALNFEVMLANITRKYETSTYENYTIQKLIEKFERVKWLHYFSSILGIQVDKNEPFIINSLEFLTDVIHLIERTDNRTLANYMMWRLIDQSLPLLSCTARNLNERTDSLMWWEPPLYTECYTAAIYRWRFCISLLQESMRTAVRSYYMQRYLAEESREDALNMTEYIRAAFINVLSNSTWMDEETKEKAKEKIQAVQFHIAYKRELLNDSYVNDLHRNLIIRKEDSHFLNVLKIFKWLTDNSFSRLRSPKKLEKLMSATGKFTYDYTRNKIVLRAGIIQDPFFIYDRTKFINFGALGSLIARELALVIVGQGQRSDRKGNDVNWWSNNATQRFEEKSQCIRQRYRSYAFHAGAFTPKITNKLLVETTADTIGLKAAYWVRNISVFYEKIST